MQYHSDNPQPCHHIPVSENPDLKVPSGTECYRTLVLSGMVHFPLSMDDTPAYQNHKGQFQIHHSQNMQMQLTLQT